MVTTGMCSSQYNDSETVNERDQNHGVCIGVSEFNVRRRKVNKASKQNKNQWMEGRKMEAGREGEEDGKRG